MSKIISYEELQAHTKKENLYVLIHDKVYNVSQFLDEHPGGDEVILAEAGKDATEAFEDVGHSDEARELLPPMLVGEFSKEDAAKFRTSRSNQGSNAAAHAVEQGSNMMYFVPLTLLGAYFAWRFYGSA